MFGYPKHPRNLIQDLKDEVRLAFSPELVSFFELVQRVILAAKVFGVIVMFIAFSLGVDVSENVFPSTSPLGDQDKRSRPARPLEFGSWRYDREGYLVRQRHVPAPGASAAALGANRVEMTPEKPWPLPTPSPLARQAANRWREPHCADRQVFRSYADCKEYHDQRIRQAADLAAGILKATFQAGSSSPDSPETDERRLTPQESKSKLHPSSKSGRAPKAFRPRVRLRFR